jgi:hypothetical protein
MQSPALTTVRHPRVDAATEVHVLALGPRADRDPPLQPLPDVGQRGRGEGGVSKLLLGGTALAVGLHELAEAWQKHRGEALGVDGGEETGGHVIRPMEVPVVAQQADGLAELRLLLWCQRRGQVAGHRSSPRW